MNAEHMQQIYGGEIGDYLTKTNAIDFSKVSHGPDVGTDIANIYNSQVANKGKIDTTNLLTPNINLTSLIDQRPPDPMQQMLNNTLTKIAKEVGLEGDPAPIQTDINTLLKPKDQSSSDIQQAQSNIAAALAELKSLGAI
jgi:hypothetical protein